MCDRFTTIKEISDMTINTLNPNSDWELASGWGFQRIRGLGTDFGQDFCPELRKSRHEIHGFHVNLNWKENQIINAIRAKNTFVCSARNKYALTVSRIEGVVGLWTFFFSEGLCSCNFCFRRVILVVSEKYYLLLFWEEYFLCFGFL